MKILKFNESKDDFFFLIKDYFSTFEEIEDICNVEFIKVSNNFFNINIYLKSRNLLLKIDDGEKMVKLDQEIKNKKDDIRILMELKRSMQMLIDEDIVEEFYIEGNSLLNYKIEIYTKGTSIEWISINIDWQIKYDRNILRKILLDKFKVNLLNIEIDDDEVNFIIEVEPITKEKAEDIKNFFLKTRAIDPEGDNIDVFEQGKYNKYRPTISFINFEINNLLGI